MMEDPADQLASRVQELLGPARKRFRDDDPAPPPPMLSAPAGMSTSLSRAQLDSLYKEVTEAGYAFISSGGKVCKPKADFSFPFFNPKGKAAADEDRAAPHKDMASSACTPNAPDPAGPAPAPPRRNNPPAPPSPAAAPAADTSSEDPVSSDQDPDVKNRPWTAPEDLVIREGVRHHGHKWVVIAALLQNRTPDAVRNRFHRLEGAAKPRAGPDARTGGYKCKKCGQRKRGHSCPKANTVHFTDVLTADGRRELSDTLTARNDDDLSDFVDSENELITTDEEGNISVSLSDLLRRLNSGDAPAAHPPVVSLVRKVVSDGIAIKDLDPEWRELLGLPEPLDGDGNQEAGRVHLSDAADALLPDDVDDILDADTMDGGVRFDL